MSEVFEMPNHQKKKQLKNKAQANPGLISAIQVFKNGKSKAFLAALCLLTIIVLATITGGFGSFQGLVRADYVKGNGVGIYWNPTCTNITSAFIFGQINPGSNRTLTIYVKNECSSPVELSLETTNWAPSSSAQYICLEWNYTNQNLKVNEVIPIEITLTINASIYGITDFSFNTNIIASQH